MVSYRNNECNNEWGHNGLIQASRISITIKITMDNNGKWINIDQHQGHHRKNRMNEMNDRMNNVMNEDLNDGSESE